MLFLQVDKLKKQQLIELYEHEEAEASALFNLILGNIELYNRKLSSLDLTRHLIEGMTGSDEFSEWDSKFKARVPMKLDTLKERPVSIFFFN